MIPAVGALGSEAAIGSIGSPGAQPTGATSGAGAEAGGFGAALGEAVSSLEQTQQSAAGAAQGLATGTAGDPESAVVTVENAQLAMELAAQIRNKATEAAQSIFQTQI